MRRRKRHRGGGSSRVAFLVLGVVTTCVAIGALAVAGWVIGMMASAPDLTTIKPVEQGQSSVVYAADGQRLGFIQADTLRTPVPREAIPTNLRNATVAIEDRRFYSHKGVDVEGVFRAAVKNISSGHTVEGGSTLTMQLIKNLYDPQKKRTFSRKIREAKLAQELESEHPGIEGKRWILDRYLNSVPYGTVGGQMAVGVQAAARMFFSKPASRLTLAEAALLAGLPQAPSLYDPLEHPERALARRNDVLRAMMRARQITPETAQEAMQEPLGTSRGRYYTERRESYFFDYVRDQLVKRYGIDTVRRGGLKVYTTVDLKLQKLARAAIARRLANPGDPSAALVSIDPSNGHILAMASSQTYAASKFNLAAQGKRQPGSTFKVMALMAALRRGVDPSSTTYISRRLLFRDPKWGPIDVQTDDHSYRGRTTLFEGLVKSDNTVYMQLGLDLGPEEVRQTAYDMGITSHLDAYPSIALGGLTRGVSPLEMTRAYVTINTGGYRVRPVAVTKVVFPDKHVDTSLAKQSRKKIFTDGQTYEAIKAMEANVQRGTGTAAQLSGCTAAGKTGTTSSFTDAWFDGFTTGLNTTVWVGYPKSTASMTNVPPYGEMFGGTAPALIWHDFMQTAAKGRCQDFPKPQQPFQGAPFFGHYARGGAPGRDTTVPEGGQNSYGVDTPQAAAPAPSTDGTTDQAGNGKGGGKAGGGNSQKEGYDPDLYESPPQKAPSTPAPSGGADDTGSPNNGGASPGG
jgi:penicillin-binding protein 1A